MFQLTADEKAEVVTNCDHLARLKFSPSLPYAFTEHGAIMAANVLNNVRAARLSVHVVRAFVRLRQAATAYAELAAKLSELERKLGIHDVAIRAIVDSIQRLAALPAPAVEKPPITGFKVREPAALYRRRRTKAG